MEQIRLRAEQGNAEAQCELADMYFYGEGVDQNYIEAYKWYLRSSDQGNADAQVNLGVMYYIGKVIGQDYKQAYIFFSKAADKGNCMAEYFLGSMYCKGEGVEQNYSKAAKLFDKSAVHEIGNTAPAKYELGRLYFWGKGIEQNYNKAFELITAAAEQGYIDAQTFLGSSYYFGEGVTKNYNEAIKWLKGPAERGDKVARDLLDTIYKKIESEKSSQSSRINQLNQSTQFKKSFFEFKEKLNTKNTKGLFIKTLSILSGSSEETLLNARAELSNKFGSGKLSCETERIYVFETLERDLPIVAKDIIPKLMTREEADKLELKDVVTIACDYYNYTKQHEFMRIFNRVMVYFYNLEIGNIKSLEKSLMLFSIDFANFMYERR